MQLYSIHSFYNLYFFIPDFYFLEQWSQAFVAWLPSREEEGNLAAQVKQLVCMCASLQLNLHERRANVRSSTCTIWNWNSETGFRPLQNKQAENLQNKKMLHYGRLNDGL